MVNQILSETIADKEVIRILLRTIAQMKGSNKMSKITLFNHNGVIMAAQSFEPVSRENIVDAITKTEEELAELRQALADFDALNTPSTPAVQPTPEPMPEVVPTAQPEAPQVAPEPLTDTNIVAAPEAPAVETVAPADIQPAPVVIQ